MLVTALLDSISATFLSYGSHQPSDELPAAANLDSYLDVSLAHACILTPTAPPCATTTSSPPSSRQSSSGMDLEIDFGSTAGFQERAKKKKGGTTKFDPWADSDKKDDSAAGDDNTGAGDGTGGNGFGGAAGDAGGSGGGDDDGDNAEDYGGSFDTAKKTKKKAKKKQDGEDEEGEGRDRKEEMDPIDGADAANSLSWADNTYTNADVGGDDYTNSWSTGKKEKKKKVRSSIHVWR